MLARINQVTHRTLAEIVAGLPDEVVRPALSYPGVWELIEAGQIADAALEAALLRHRAVAEPA